MIQLWNTKNNISNNNKKIKSIGIKQLLLRSLRTHGLRNKKRKESGIRYGTRYDFQANHGFRKWFKTRCELAGMKSINIEKLMGHSIGISDSYYRATEKELLEDYLKAVDYLTISNEHKLQKDITNIIDQSDENYTQLKFEILKKEAEITLLKEEELSNSDAIAALSERVRHLTKEIELLKRKGIRN